MENYTNFKKEVEYTIEKLINNKISFDEAIDNIPNKPKDISIDILNLISEIDSDKENLLEFIKILSTSSSFSDIKNWFDKK